MTDYLIILISSLLTLCMFLLKNYKGVYFLFTRSYRFEKMNSHQNTLTILEYVDDPNLNLIYKDSLKDEAFERISKLRNLDRKVRDKLITLYPQIREEFSINQIKRVKDYFYLNKTKINLRVSSIKNIVIIEVINTVFFICFVYLILLLLVAAASWEKQYFNRSIILSTIILAGGYVVSNLPRNKLLLKLGKYLNMIQS
ncbi:hypothetical protein JKA74_11590 [Marivirga sp. S37H4]|uniref:Uncharacterized protein n=1 Tax=Marivirga aurantiaca TaxID=2802615 RepID=A0A934WZK8_9BACT|nr:hypothetical protein [Marivirga aurantiaca]MBK6265681.1 hypothetical protein [Marivirga aurantiaca]